MIAVLLSTYNGEEFLKEQLDSLFFQSVKEFVLVARDDGSRDNTLKILKDYAKKYENLILLPTNENLGIKKSFEILLNYALNMKNIEFFMFCDQDDVWMKNKIEKSVQLISDIKGPALGHTDLYVTDENLNVLHNSFWKYQHINPSLNQLNRILLQNTVTGCSMIINRPLAEMSKFIPDEAIMHDWWFALNASAFGKIIYLNEPTIYYRQHCKNDIGAQKYGIRYLMKKLQNQNFGLLDKNILQARKFYTLHKDKLSLSQKKILKNFIALQNMNFFQKRLILFKYKFFKSGLLRNLGLMVKI
jgi:glycosyltransferase involved in cell wall biosynthesis